MTLATEPQPTTSAQSVRGPRTAIVVLTCLAGLLMVAILSLDLEREAVGMLVVFLIIVLLLSGVHVAVSIIVASCMGLYSLGGTSVLFALLREVPFSAVATWQYSVIPFFILMGMTLWKAGISAKAYEAARQWFGGAPGGLAIGTIVTGGGLAAASGSTIGIAYALGRVGLPEMSRSRYDPGVAIGAVSMAGVLGQIIPPSVMLVIYAGIAQTPVGPQLVAGVIPGILLMVGYCVMIFLRGVLRPSLVPKIPRDDVTVRSKMRSLVGASPLALVIVLIIGGLLTGTMTATEAGAVGAAITLVLGLLMLPRGRRVRDGGAFLRDCAMGTATAVGSIFLLLISIYFLTRLMAFSQTALWMAEVVSGWGLTPFAFLLLLIPLFLVLGCFLDTIAILLITVPVLIPTLAAMEIDLLWFGVFVVILAELAMVTPPLGILVFIVHNIARSTRSPEEPPLSLWTAFKGIGWYLLVSILVVLGLIAAPELVTWLPSVMQ